jgi:hypothetical protein
VATCYLGEICRETLRDHAALNDRLGKFPLEFLIISATYPIGCSQLYYDWRAELWPHAKNPGRLRGINLNSGSPFGER